MVDADGRRITVRPHASDDTVADLAAALGVTRSECVTIDGRRIGADRRLVGSGLRIGSVVSTVGPPPVTSHSGTDGDTPPDPLPTQWQIAVTAGPDCSTWSPLSIGRHVIGRSPSAAITIEDPSVELHHGRIEVDRDGVTFTQLTGRVPARVSGRCAEGPTPLPPGATLHLGSSIVEVREVREVRAVGPSLAPQPGPSGSLSPTQDPWRKIVRRAPPAPGALGADDPLGDPVCISVPEPPTERRGPPASGLIGAAVAVAGAAVMALVLGQLLFALFAAVGAVAALATWAVGAGAATRDRRRGRQAHDAARAAFVAALERAHLDAPPRHRRRHPSVTAVLAELRATQVWWCRRDPGHHLQVTIARGAVRWQPPIATGDDPRGTALDAALVAATERCGILSDVSIPLTITSGSTVVLHGDRELGTSLARSIIVQAAVRYGPADWSAIVLTDRPEEWSWTAWLPHAASPLDCTDAGHADSIRELNWAPDPQRLVVVTDVADLLTERTGPLRRVLAAGAACVVVVPATAAPPAVATTVITLGTDGSVHGPSGVANGAAGDAVLTGLSRGGAIEAALAMAHLVDPEDEVRGGALPAAVSMSDIGSSPASPSEIAATWRSGGTDPSLRVTIGRADDGLVAIDLARDGPHGLVAGTTGAGKSELLRTLVSGLAANVGPDHLSFVLVDFKGGSTFDACARLPHVVGVVTDLDDRLAERALVSLDAEVRRREELLRAVGADDLTGFRRVGGTALARLVVVVDEFATLAREHPDFLSSLVGVAQRGRSLGIHLLLATQRPAGVVTDEIRANTNLRIALRVGDRADALDVVGDGAPAMFPRDVPGRAVLRLGGDELVVFQAASCTGPRPAVSDRLRVEPTGWPHPCTGDVAVATRVPTELEALVASIEGAARVAGGSPPHRPWLPPLPHRLDLEALPAVDGTRPVGLTDDPSRQLQFPLRWEPATGNLLVVGSIGSGTTSTAVAVVGSCVRSMAPQDCHVYVIDGRGDRCWDDIGLLDHCGAVIRLPEAERLVRLVDRLTDDLAQRVAIGSSTPQIVVVVDGVGALRAALGELGLGEAQIRFDRLLADGPAVGISSCMVTDGATVASLTVPAAHRWIHHVADPAIARAVGLTAPIPPVATPGRIRLASSGLEAQVVLDPLPLGSTEIRAGAGGPAPIEVLPEWVRPDAIDEDPTADAGRGTTLTVGIGSDLAPAHLVVPNGDHVFVGGAAHTGKTTALCQLRASWQRRHPSGRVIVIHPADDVAAALRTLGGADAGPTADSPPVLVVVDDADRVLDPSGVLAALVETRRSGVTVMAAARLEAVRTAYGHWVRAVTRSRCGLLLTSAGDVDGELLGVTVPRRPMIAARPGLAWMVDGFGLRLVQVAARMPE